MEKKENKTMKKGLTIAVLALLLGIVGYTGGNTFAKYITEATPVSESATVAQWGFTANVEAGNLFGKQYGEVSNSLAKVSDNSLVVKASTSAGNIVAPGTTGSMKITVEGQAEVNAKIDFDVKITDIYIGSYYPVKWTVTRASNDEAATTVVDGLKGADVNTYFNTTIADQLVYAAGSGSYKEVFVISWAWDFEQGEDKNDTLLGEQQGDSNVMVVDLAVSISQVQ